MYNRSFHFIPAHKSKFYKKYKTVGADHYIFDLEDSVPGEQKEGARNKLIQFFSIEMFPNFWIRINDLNSNEFRKDELLLMKFPDIGVVLPKINKPIEKYDAEILKNRKKIILIENFEALEHLPIILNGKNIFAVGLGLEDMLSPLVIANNLLTDLTKYIHLKFICIIKAKNILVIDGISNNINDTEKLIDECRDIRNMGFDGKFTIHPNQVETINSEFDISSDMKKWAEKIKLKTELKPDIGYIKIDEEIVTPPKIEKAKKIMQVIGEISINI